MTPPEAPVGRLTVCPTPIGNLDDITLRALIALRECDVVACEDTRHTRGLLDRHGIQAHLVSLHEHNERARAGELVARMREGDAVALVSDAGTPLVSDPGFALVQAALAAEIELEVLPGASSVLVALVASGLPSQRWRFVGFLPRARTQLTQLVSDAPDTVVAFESPRRLAATLDALAEREPRRRMAVCRELTKLHEEVRRGSATELADHYRDATVRGEVVVVLGASAAEDVGLEAAVAAVRELIEAGARPRPAAAVIARLTGHAANRLYREIVR